MNDEKDHRSQPWDFILKLMSLFLYLPTYLWYYKFDRQSIVPPTIAVTGNLSIRVLVVSWTFAGGAAAVVVIYWTNRSFWTAP